MTGVQTCALPISSSKLKNLTFYQPTAFTNLTPEVLTTRITPDEEIYIYSPSITNGPSSFTSYGVSNTGNVWFGYQSPNASDPLYNGPISLIKDSNGNYTTSKVVSQYDFWSRVSSSLLTGEEWYVSFYTGSITLPITPFNRDPNKYKHMPLNLLIRATSSAAGGGMTSSSIFEQNGVFKIISTTSSSVQLSLLAKIPNTASRIDYNIQYGYNATYGTPGAISSSAIFWKSNPTGSSILLKQSTIDISTNIDGYFTTNTVSPFIKNNANTIAETFGNKPKP